MGHSKKKFSVAKELIEGHSIPAQPEVLHAVLKEKNALAPNLNIIIENALQDVSLSAAILQAANTVLPGRKGKVTSISQAIVLLGISELREIVVNLFMNTAFIQKSALSDQFGNRTTNTAKICAYLAEELPQLSPAYASGYLPKVPSDEAYTLGLFHACGFEVMMRRYADYEEIYRQAMAHDSLTLTEIESDYYGTDHCAVGYTLCQSWDFPKLLCQSVLDQREVSLVSAKGKKTKKRDTFMLTALLKLAEYYNGELSPYEWSMTKPHLLQFFGLTETDLETTLKDACQKLTAPVQQQ